MPMRSLSAGKKAHGKRKDSAASKKKGRKNLSDEETLDPQQEQINALVREQEQIRSKLNMICSRIIENINIEDYLNDIDLSKQQPSDMSLDKILSMVDELCYFRNAFLNLIQETDDEQKRPIQDRITQLSVEEPQLVRKFLTSDQRLTFVARERDLWKENAEFLQMMYATIVDQLEMGVFQKLNPNATDILQAHRLNLEDACRIFLSPSSRSLIERHVKKIPSELEQPPQIVTDPNVVDTSEPVVSVDVNENVPPTSSTCDKIKRRVSFADKVDIITDDTHTNDEDQTNGKTLLPLARETLIEKMDSNLRMLIIKELSKDSQIPKPLSKMSSIYRTNSMPYQQQNRSLKWVEFARLTGINESEIEHWLSQSLQYPAGRVMSTWCNCTSPPPTVAELHSVVSSNRLNRLDLARSIETMYRI
ncbi:hypothetical protein I4U23_013382 [Adineta vaga]|nr:hypothetical protein I4U23_013382 [Adineta vaga]